MTQDIATVKNEKKRKQKEVRRKRKLIKWLLTYAYITYTRFYPKSLYYIYIYIYIYKLYHIHNILCLWQLHSLEFSLAIILRNEKL